MSVKYCSLSLSGLHSLHIICGFMCVAGYVYLCVWGGGGGGGVHRKNRSIF